MPPQKASEGELLDKEAKRLEILHDGYYYDVTDWVKKHPGGGVINYYTKQGEDATQAIQQFHFRSEKRVQNIMKSLKRRPAEKNDPILDLATAKRHAALTEDFNRLQDEFVAEGLFEPSVGHVVLRFIEVLVLGLIGYKLFCYENMFMKIPGALLLGLTQGKLGWIQHEGGHNSFTGYPKIDKIIQAASLGLGGGLSAAWWNSQHNRHHAMPQRIRHDVDLNTLPFVAFNVKVIDDPKQGKNVFIRYQSLLYFTLDIFLLMFYNRLYLQPRSMIFKKSYSEVIWVGINWLWVYHLGWWYFPISYFSLVYLLGNFSLNHTHLEVTNTPTHWVEYSLLHTADIEHSLWCDWWMGFLNYQIEHHLFPTMPQFRNKRIVSRVKALAEKHGLPYQVYSYKQALLKTVDNLNTVAKELQLND